jgi:hypothetical protein
VNDVARRRSLHIAIALFVAVSFQGAYAAPKVTIAALRAALCCAGNCHHSRTLNGAAQCCQVPQPEDSAVVSKVRPLVPHPLAILATRESATAAAAMAPVIDPTREVFTRPAPIFLLDRSLRL